MILDFEGKYGINYLNLKVHIKNIPVQKKDIDKIIFTI
jgi:hypothetical protein